MSSMVYLKRSAKAFSDVTKNVIYLIVNACNKAAHWRTEPYANKAHNASKLRQTKELITSSQTGSDASNATRSQPSFEKKHNNINLATQNNDLHSDLESVGGRKSNSFDVTSEGRTTKRVTSTEATMTLSTVSQEAATVCIKDPSFSDVSFFAWAFAT